MILRFTYDLFLIKIIAIAFSNLKFQKAIILLEFINIINKMFDLLYVKQLVF